MRQRCRDMANPRHGYFPNFGRNDHPVRSWRGALHSKDAQIMDDKWTHRAVGAGVGAIAMLFALPFGAGWYTAGGAKFYIRGSHECAYAAVC